MLRMYVANTGQIQYPDQGHMTQFTASFSAMVNVLANLLRGFIICTHGHCILYMY